MRRERQQLPQQQGQEQHTWIHGTVFRWLRMWQLQQLQLLRGWLMMQQQRRGWVPSWRLVVG